MVKKYSFNHKSQKHPYTQQMLVSFFQPILHPSLLNMFVSVYTTSPHYMWCDIRN